MYIVKYENKYRSSEGEREKDRERENKIKTDLPYVSALIGLAIHPKESK